MIRQDKMNGEDHDDGGDDLYEKYIEGNRCPIINAIDPVRCYFDKLRDLRVLTIDDIEEIINKNPTRRFKAGQFLDILRTKGNQGVQCFLDLLEFQNPETFKRVVKRIPRPPPPGFVRSSDFPDLDDILVKIPETIKVIHDEVKGNTDLKLKVQELEQCLHANQNDKDELQVENDRQRIENNSLKTELDELSRKCGDLVKQNVTLKEDSMEYLRNSLEYSRERDQQREKCTAALMEKNDMERQLIEMREKLSEKYQFTCSISHDSTTSRDKTDELKDKSDSELKISFERKIERLDVEKQILKEELEESRQNCEDIINRMSETNSQLNEAQSKCHELEKKVKTLTKEKNLAQQTYHGRKEKVEKYFHRIQQLEEEKRALEEERLLEQKKLHKESSLRTELFKEKHELENQFEELKILYDQMVKRNSQISLQGSIRNHPEVGSTMVDEFPGEVIPGIKYNTLPANLSGLPHIHNPPPSALTSLDHRQSQPLKRRIKANGPKESFSSIPQGKMRPDSEESVQVHVSNSLRNKQRDGDLSEEQDGLDQDVIHCYVSSNLGSEKSSIGVSSTDSNNRKDTTSETSEDSNSTTDDIEQYEMVDDMIPEHPVFCTEGDTQHFTVTLGMPALMDQIEIIGGNHTGIFINKLLKKPAEQCLKVGDQILSVVKNKKNGERVPKTFIYCTREEVYKTLDLDTNSTDITSVELKCVRNPTLFKEVLQWMTNTNSCGDYFFVRSNFKCSGDDGEHQVQIGDIYCVLDTKSRPKHWRVNSYEKSVQAWQTEPVYIPNKSQALRSDVRVQRLRRTDSIDKTINLGVSRGRTGGIRCRNEHYTRVLPVKAKSKSPVVLFGADEIVTRVQEMIAAGQSILHTEIVGHNVLDILKHFPQERTDAHVLRKGSLCPSERNQSIRIILYLCVHNTASPEQLRSIFGEDFKLEEDRPDTVLEGHLQSMGLNYNAIHIPSDEIHDKTSLLDFIIERVTYLQNRVYWLGTQSLCPTDREHYQFILGPLHQHDQTTEECQSNLNLKRSASDVNCTETQADHISMKPVYDRSKSHY